LIILSGLFRPAPLDYNNYSIEGYWERGKKSEVTDAAYETLTPREQEVLVLLAEGFSKEEVAERLFISSKTVENHRSHIMSKLELHSPVDLVRYATKLGLIDVDLWKE